ncbi:uncharacterized protein LOC115744016 isoform X2 [Rhodamnia argentea]|uniref:Uncharacterized protein LOC115744016 isoform X2 n=1 Tax=Rhodamnia argentea TaxID=178133 RepID=A0A8B8PKP0_9MYRT|nr:uncharacterized protein LOC115744016 isoform X3 [Rhodamnia argentea]XP_030534954.1 uncharacterized protein LOC115744016 isoform X2 [Rhodamnia argentea]
MAGYGYYRSQSPYGGFDPWKAEWSCNSEQLCRPALDESEGRRVIAGDPFQSPGTYVMKVETTVERVHPSMFSEYYRQCSPPRYEHRPRYGGVNNRPHGPLIPSNDRPPVVEEFFNNIQNEVSQRPSGFGAPRAPHQLRIPVSAGSYGTTNAGDSEHETERRKLIANTIKDEDRKADKILKPPVTTEGGNWPRPGYPAGSVLPSRPISSEREQTVPPPSMIMTGHRDRRGPSMELSKPINDIGTAMEYLKKVAVPSSVNTIKDEDPDHGYLKGDKIPKPPEGGPAARSGNPTRSMLPNYYTSSERGERTVQPPSRTITGGWERRSHDVGLEPMNETGKTMEYSKEAVKPPPVNTVPKRDSNPETIDSREAARRYNGRFVE